LPLVRVRQRSAEALALQSVHVALAAKASRFTASMNSWVPC